MKKSLIALAVLGASSVAFAASNVTLYGVIDTGVLVQKAKHQDTTVGLNSGFVSGSRWGIKGVEDLGNGYNVGFVLEEGYDSDTGANTASNSAGKVFGRESQLYVQGGFGKLGFGRFGTLGSGAGSYHMLTGWALTTSYGLSSWTSEIGTSFSRVDNAVVYVAPNFNGLTLSAMYSNKMKGDDQAQKWSKNNHYYGIGAKYKANAITSSLIFEAKQIKEAADTNKNTQYAINFGFEYNLGSVTPMFAYQYAWQDEGKKTNMFGLSAKVPVAGGDVLAGARYLFGKDKSLPAAGDQDVNSWNIGAAYVYPLSKRTNLNAYAGYADSGKGWKDRSTKATDATAITPVYNGYQLYVGMVHTF
uniref:porin n=1 Tax=Turicimonas muris TaxID=1796652 RepID=UPI00402A93D4